jgi:deferrochelatase/peroxidase EfeB
MVSRQDDKGIICPFSAHIRKVNPRDTVTEQGNSVDVLARMILRRGIPYGPAYPGDLEQDGPASAADAQQDRGLIFVSYQTSIEEQFKFLQRTWANHRKNPNGEGGEDPIIGQGNRAAGGGRVFQVRAAGQPKQTLSLPTDWVIPTGGGYFFSPSISTLTNVLGKAR